MSLFKGIIDFFSSVDPATVIVSVGMSFGLYLIKQGYDNYQKRKGLKKSIIATLNFNHTILEDITFNQSVNFNTSVFDTVISHDNISLLEENVVKLITHYTYFAEFCNSIQSKYFRNSNIPKIEENINQELGIKFEDYERYGEKSNEPTKALRIENILRPISEEIRNLLK